MSFDSPTRKLVSLQFGEFSIIIAQIEKPESLIDDFLTKNENDEDVTDERIPYWAELWPSAIALSGFIAENPGIVSGKKITEIGCGLGLAGIVAAKFGAEVTLTDYLPAALEFTTHNWKLNFDIEPDVRILDWRKPDNIQPADVLIASDVAYERKSFKALLNAIKLLVKRDGVVLISEPNRDFAGDFFSALKKEGYRIKEEIRKINKDGINYNISIHVCSNH